MTPAVTGKDLLNRVQRLLIDHANAKGISLDAEFGTVDRFKEFVVAFTFRILTDAGMSTEAAFDTIFGGGAYVDLAERTWNTLQAKDAAQ